MNYSEIHSGLTSRQVKFIRRWEKKRLWTPWKYFILDGCIKEGLIFFFIIPGLQMVFDLQGTLMSYSGIIGFIRLLIIFVLCMSVGWIFGWWKRRSYEKEYNMLKRMQQL
jgi:hypothetical protein